MSQRNRDENQVDEISLRRDLSDVFAFVRSREINKSLSAIVLDDLIQEAIVAIDSTEIPEGTSVTSVDSTGRNLFVVEGEWTSVVRRKGSLQRLTDLAGRVLSRSQFSRIFSGYEQPETLTDESLFDRLRDAPQIETDSDVETALRQETSRMVSITVKFTVGGETVEKTIEVPEDLVSPEARNSPAGIEIDSSFQDGSGNP